MVNLYEEVTTPNGHTYTQPLGLFINNEIVQASSGSHITSIDPATENIIATVQAASAEDVDKAVQAAKKALQHQSWKNLPGTQRAKLMAKFADLIEENQELLASVDAWDNGMPYSAAMAEDVPEAINTIRYFSGWADKIFGQTISTTHEKFAYTLRQPIGVVAQIIPWNYPLLMAAWKLGPALACGNTIVLKAAEQTPLSILLLGQLVKRAGFPAGVVNLINGHGREAGTALVQHPLVDKVAFTGSTATAKLIMATAARTLKNVTLESGGKSPLVVFSDADLEQAVKWSHLGIMSNSGQICTATSRILVQRVIYHSFISKFKEAVNTISVIGDQWQESTYQGPQVSKAQYDRVLSYVKMGKEEGATLAMGGEPCAIDGKGYYIKPTIFTDVEDSMRIYHEEVFGPFVVISPFDDEQEAISRANSTSYGLGASVFTNDLQRAHRVAAEIEAGMVWINSSQDCDYRIPFGGVKQSGIGRELGTESLDAYTQVKAVHVNMGLRL
ncbi:MAG: hypothetical protein M1812_005829 [Candelaria pacifica]|nr:MAG: hypothetical protein M1812_005829 [Candelaria pacifica]